MRIVEPVTISDSQLADSNIVETLPNAVSSATYNAWSAATTYAAGNIVCHTFTTGYPYLIPSGTTPFQPTFVVFTALFSSLLNREPARFYQTTSTLPGVSYWTTGLVAQVYDPSVSYAVGAVVGHINGTTGALYESRISNNIGNTPNSSPTQWRQSTVDSYATWSSGTTYAAGDRSVIFFGTRGEVYTSLAGSNTNNPPETSPAWWRYDGDSYKAYAAATTYAAGDKVLDINTRHIYESAVGSNTGQSLSDTSKWLDTGPSNRYAMFDTSNSSQTIAPDEIDVSVALPQVCDTLALLNMSAQQVRIVASEAAKTLYLNFTASETLDSRITASGGTNGTRVNSAGLIVAGTCPRFDYDPVTLAPLGLLIEGQRTNLMLRSQEFDNASWTKANCSITANAATAPDGTFTADKIVENTADATHIAVQYPVGTATAVASVSVFIKAAGRTAARVLCYDGTATFYGIIIDLTTGAVLSVEQAGTHSSDSYRIEEFPNGWWRVSASTAYASANKGLYVQPTIGTTVSYLGDGASGIYVWGAQCEDAKTFSSSYIPTTTASVTRTADNLSMTGTNFSDWFNTAEGTFVVEIGAGLVAGDHDRGMVSASNGTQAESINLLLNTALTTFYCTVWDGGSNVADVGTGIGTRAAIAYKANDFAGAVDGTSQTDTFGTLPTVDRLIIGDLYSASDGYKPYGHIRVVKYYNVRKSNTFLESETTAFTDYDITVDMLDTGSVTDWRHYFFDPVTYSSALIVNDLPPATDLTVRVIITNTGAEAACGMCMLGLADEVGGTVYGATASILSFSRKVTDDYGNATLLQRANAKRGVFKVTLTRERVDGVLDKLRALDAVPVLYQGSALYSATWSFGFYRDAAITIEQPSHSSLNIEIEELI